MRRSWGDQYIEAHAKRFVDFEDNVDEMEDQIEEQGPLFGFEQAADEDFFREEVLFDDDKDE